MRQAAAGILICLFASVVSLAQASSPAPAPSAQQKVLGYFTGDWSVAGTTKLSPKTPGVEFRATRHAEWLPGGYFVEVKSVSHGPLGDVHTVKVMEYNPSENVYTFNEYNSLGEHVVGVGTTKGNTWTWNTSKKLNGVAVKGRYVEEFVSADSYSFQSQVAKPGGGWMTVTQGTANRVPTAN